MGVITLENKFLRVEINPDEGASVVAFSVCRAAGWLELLPDTEPSFLMVPYSNRIENGSFVFEGRSYQLANAEQHALHGVVLSRSWTVKQVSSSQVCCEFSSASSAAVNWPWPFEVQVEYHLLANALASRLVLWNRGQSAMPAGMGWHPYYNRALSRPGELVQLCMKVQRAYPDANGNRIPSGPAEPLTAAQDFSAGKPLAPEHFLDTCFQGYDGQGYIAWPESGLKLNYQCTRECTHLVVYNPRLPYFAVEPVTNANNGVNLYSQGEPQSGIVSLAPGSSLEAGFVQQVEVLN